MRTLCQHLLARHQGAAQLPPRLVLLGLVVYAFSLADHRAGAEQLAGAAQRVDRASSTRTIRSCRGASRSAFLPPYFKPPQHDRRARHRPADEHRAATPSSSTSRRNFERDVLAGRSPALQVDVDATAMMQAGIGAGYAQQIIDDRDRRLRLAHARRAARRRSISSSASPSTRTSRPPGSPASWASSTTSRCWRSSWPARPSCASASTARWIICWSCR